MIELLVVLAAIALLLGIVAPRYVSHVDRAREAALRSNLAALRDAIDKFHADRDSYPDKLADLVEARYLRAVPVDPVTERDDTWRLSPPRGQAKGIGDVRSGAAGAGPDGRPYADW
ncbi:general secretion pathway protein G [Kinneretia asaccharophila]|uniref:General secretion pathway protein G n=1 Tax=Roseateles asaccharophilus TaxID=582607 RepID=A0ABU2ADX7_9BURK|nr:general secretion pathway protein G [Roseateles asaccharophilus]